MTTTCGTRAKQEKSVRRSISATQPPLRRRALHPSRRGITLVEVSISALLVGMLVVASLQSVANIGRTWTVTNQVVDRQGLGLDLIRETLAQTYMDPTDTSASTWGPEAGQTTRATFNDIDDYDDWIESPPKDPAGAPLAGYTGWSRSVIVKKHDRNNYSLKNDSQSDEELRSVTVTVTSPGGSSATAAVYRSRLGGTLQPMSADVTLVTWVGCTLTLGTNAPATSGISVSNHAEDQ